MHRTTTTATLLVTVAVSALTGCVTIQRPPVPGPPPTTLSQPPAPRPDGQAEPQIVQAPAREALEMIGPSRAPRSSTPTPGRAAPQTPARPQEHQERTRPAHPDHPEQRRPEVRHPHPRPPHIEVPDVTKSVPRGPEDVCALGKKYGRWQEDSPEAAICKQAYGR
ncbi:hypothetical protein ABZ896_15650 [Streptomyces sp. NPDC047072]|uniref:hypothetical protein n=1 Tax=Streptomyces sp. NPDC047072 TaxID=3154809 RepID=UPI0033ECB63E